jgi:hypothetical protein
MRRLVNPVVVALVAATAVVTAGTANADPGPVAGAGYVWANSPTTASYTPDPTYQMNSVGTTIRNTITRHGTGHYTVRFPRLGVSGGVAHATAYGNYTHQCKPDTWVATGGDQNVVVRCFTLAGAPVDSMFTASFTNKRVWPGFDYGRTYPGAYVHLTNSSSANSTPPYHQQFNSAGMTNTVSRTGVGTYAVFLPEIGRTTSGGHARVTAAGYGATRCKVVNFGWATPASTIRVNIRCFDTAGTPTDSRFSMTFTDRTNTLGLNGCCNPDGHQSAYALANNATAASYTPSLSYQHEVPSGGATASRAGTGNYFMKFTNADLATGHVHVAATGWDAEFCKVNHWNTSAGINVRCFSPTGAPVDTQYELDYTGPWLLG